MNGRLAIIPDFVVPLVLPASADRLAATPADPAAKSSGADTLSEFAQLVQQVTGEAIVQQNIPAILNGPPQPTTAASANVASAAPVRLPLPTHLVMPTPAPATRAPEVPVVRAPEAQLVKASVAPVHAESKGAAGKAPANPAGMDQLPFFADAAVQTPLPKPVIEKPAPGSIEPPAQSPPPTAAEQESERPEIAITRSATPAPVRAALQPELPKPAAPGLELTAATTPRAKSEAPPSVGVASVPAHQPQPAEPEQNNLPVSATNETAFAAQPQNPPPPARIALPASSGHTGDVTLIARRAQQPTAGARTIHVPVESAKHSIPPPRTNQSIPIVPSAAQTTEPPAPMNSQPVAPNVVFAPLPQRADTLPLVQPPNSSTIPAVTRPAERAPAASAGSVRQTRPAFPAGRTSHTAPASAVADVAVAVSAPSFATPAPPIPAAAERAHPDTAVPSIPAAPHDTRPDPGPAAVELQIKPQTPAQPAAPATSQRPEQFVRNMTTPSVPVPEATPAPIPAAQSIPNVTPPHAVPAIVSAPAPRALPQSPASRAEASAATGTHVAEALPEPPKQSGAPLRAISIDFTPDGAQDVRVRLAEHAGDVHVSLHTADAGLAGRLADGVHDLVGTLASAGYDAEAWTPGEGRQNQRQQQEPPQQHADTEEGSEEFSAMMQQSNEEVS